MRENIRNEFEANIALDQQSTRRVVRPRIQEDTEYGFIKVAARFSVYVVIVSVAVKILTLLV